MIKARKTDGSRLISEIVIHGIQEKKGNEVVRLDLRALHSSVADYFIICDAESSTQVRAIAHSVEEEVYKATGEQPWKKEGLDHCEWVLLDFVNVVVHIFKKEKRLYYGVEELWGDAEIKNYQSA